MVSASQPIYGSRRGFGMRTSVPLWPRDLSTRSEREAHVFLVCFGVSFSNDVPLSANRFGIPDKRSAAAYDVREHDRAANAAWFDGWRSGALRMVAESDLGTSLADLDAAEHCFTLEGVFVEPTDLGYLQAAWGLARWLVARGATVVLDAHAGRFVSGASLPPSEAELDVRREVNLIFETEPHQAAGGHILHTRGLRKFGRPDIVTICDEDEVEALSGIIWELADGMARGFLPELPRHGVDVDEETALYLVEDVDREYEELLALDNDARLLEP